MAFEPIYHLGQRILDGSQLVQSLNGVQDPESKIPSVAALAEITPGGGALSVTTQPVQDIIDIDGNTIYELTGTLSAGSPVIMLSANSSKSYPMQFTVYTLDPQPIIPQLSAAPSVVYTAHIALSAASGVCRYMWKCTAISSNIILAEAYELT